MELSGRRYGLQRVSRYGSGVTKAYIGSIMGCTLMKKIRNLLDNPWEVHIIHVFREANRCVDMLANIGSEGISGFELFENPPARVRQIVDDDCRGVSFPRLISV
jgi:hypothetical protein